MNDLVFEVSLDGRHWVGMDFATILRYHEAYSFIRLRDKCSYDTLILKGDLNE